MANASLKAHVINKKPLIINLSQINPTHGIPPGNVASQWNQAIQKHCDDLQGAPGNATSELEKVPGGYCKHYEAGTIYTDADAKVTARVYGAIEAKYNAMKGAASWLGLPIADEAPFPEGGRVSVFQHGAIYWWPDVGAIELNDVIVSYAGLVCFGETDWDQGSNSDEPYVVLGAVSPKGSNSSTRSNVYDDVDGGESRPDYIELYRGKPYGINISALLMEHDEDDPDRYKAAMTNALNDASKKLDTLIGQIPYVGPALALVAAPVLSECVPSVASALNDLFDFKDDNLGEFHASVTTKQMVVLAARTPTSTEQGVIYKLATPILSADGASYKVYFGFMPA